MNGGTQHPWWYVEYSNTLITMFVCYIFDSILLLSKTGAGVVSVVQTPGRACLEGEGYFCMVFLCIELKVAVMYVKYCYLGV